MRLNNCLSGCRHRGQVLAHVGACLQAVKHRYQSPTCGSTRSQYGRTAVLKPMRLYAL